jgi:hypothetical protein
MSLAGKALADHADGGPDHATSRQARAATIAQMERALRERAAKARRRQILGRCAIAAAALVGVGGAGRYALTRVPSHASVAPVASLSMNAVTAEGRWVAGEASIERGGQRVPFEGARLVAGDRVETGAGAHAEIGLSTGTTLVLSSAATVTWTGAAQTQSFELARGTISAHVAKLAPGARFIVRTSDAEVEVHGTVFDVELVTPDASCGAGTPTRVRVREGIVTVRVAGNEAHVTAGEVWPAGCRAPVVTRPIVTEIPAPIATTTMPTAPHPATATPLPTALPTSMPVDTLGTKNDLFAHALSARRRGDLRGALDGFESYLAHYPTGELAESASAQRMELLGKLDPSQAAAAARDYLARWPAGFARSDAESILATPTVGGAAPSP